MNCRYVLLLLALVACEKSKAPSPQAAASDTTRFYPVEWRFPLDTLIETDPPQPVVYLRSYASDTLNVVLVQADSLFNAPVVGRFGVRRVGTTWQPVYEATSPDQKASLIRTGENHWGAAVRRQNADSSWLEVDLGWIRNDRARLALMLPSSGVDTVAAHLATAARLLESLPDSVRVRRGACPFECCVYREWVAEAPVIVYADERDTSSVLFTIPKGERFDGVTGNVHITRGAYVVLGEAQKITDDVTAAIGDTLVLLNYEGEGYFVVYHTGSGATGSIEATWHGPPWTKSKNHLFGNHETEWWSQVRRKNGESGWIDMSRVELGSVDACGA